MSRSCLTTDVTESLMLDANHFHGRIRAEQEEREVGRAAPEDDRQQDEVDGHLEERVEHPPDVAEEGVAPLAPDVGRDQMAQQPTAAPGLARGLLDEPDRPRPHGAASERGPGPGGHLHARVLSFAGAASSSASAPRLPRVTRLQAVPPLRHGSTGPLRAMTEGWLTVR